MDRYISARALVGALAPDDPITCLRAVAAARAADYFLRNFPGETLYAVKTNPNPVILDAIHEAGIRRFDVASPAEIELVATRFPNSDICFMHPVKSRTAIADAYRKHGVRTFSLDSFDELAKINQATDNAADLTLLLRLAVPNVHAAYALGHKFGIPLEQAPALLRAARSSAQRLGVCFHVGSQCMHPAAYTTALQRVGDLIRRSGVIIDIVDVGGGFPSAYPDMNPPPLSMYMSAVRTALPSLPVTEQCEIWCEPGRALSAEAGSTLVRVNARKGNCLYINDGTYGSLFDAGIPKFRYPVHCIRRFGKQSAVQRDFCFYGPTCDDLDFMAGPLGEYERKNKIRSG
jgi:ornithine decarboxylase